MISDRTANIVIGVVLTIWAANVIAGIFAINGYKSSEGVNAIFTGTVGLAFMARAKAKDRAEDEKDRKP